MSIKACLRIQCVVLGWDNRFQCARTSHLTPWVQTRGSLGDIRDLVEQTSVGMGLIHDSMHRRGHNTHSNPMHLKPINKWGDGTSLPNTAPYFPSVTPIPLRAFCSVHRHLKPPSPPSLPPPQPASPPSLRVAHAECLIQPLPPPTTASSRI